MEKDSACFMEFLSGVLQVTMETLILIPLAEWKKIYTYRIYCVLWLKKNNDISFISFHIWFHFFLKIKPWEIAAKRWLDLILYIKFKHCHSTNADEAVKYFQVSLQGHTGQRPASYILLKSFKGLFVRAGMTPHRKQSLNLPKKKKKKALQPKLSFIRLGQWAQKKQSLSSGRNRRLIQQTRHKTFSAWVRRRGVAIIQIQTQPRRNNQTRDSAIYSEDPAQLRW